MSVIREKLTNLRNKREEGEGGPHGGDSECTCEEVWDDIVERVGRLEATFEALKPSMRSHEKKMGDIEAKVDVLEKCVGEMKVLKEKGEKERGKKEDM